MSTYRRFHAIGYYNKRLVCLEVGSTLTKVKRHPDDHSWPWGYSEFECPTDDVTVLEEVENGKA